MIGKVFLGGKDNLKTPAGIKQAITDPNKTLAPGYPPNVMPQTFGQSITPTDLNTLVKFLQQCSGKGATPSPASRRPAARSTQLPAVRRRPARPRGPPRRGPRPRG